MVRMKIFSLLLDYYKYAYVAIESAWRFVFLSLKIYLWFAEMDFFVSSDFWWVKNLDMLANLSWRIDQVTFGFGLSHSLLSDWFQLWDIWFSTITLKKRLQFLSYQFGLKISGGPVLSCIISVS